MTTNTSATKTNLQKAALAVGAVFLLVGVLGFIPGITTNYASLGFAGHMSEAMLLGVFQVSILHNIVHMLFGVAGILMGRTAMQAKNFLLYGGIVYLVLWVYGLLIGHDTPGQLCSGQHRRQLAASGPVARRHDRVGHTPLQGYGPGPRNSARHWSLASHGNGPRRGRGPSFIGRVTRNCRCAIWRCGVPKRRTALKRQMKKKRVRILPVLLF